MISIEFTAFCWLVWEIIIDVIMVYNWHHSWFERLKDWRVIDWLSEFSDFQSSSWSGYWWVHGFDNGDGPWSGCDCWGGGHWFWKTINLHILSFLWSFRFWQFFWLLSDFDKFVAYWSINYWKNCRWHWFLNIAFWSNLSFSLWFLLITFWFFSLIWEIIINLIMLINWNNNWIKWFKNWCIVNWNSSIWNFSCARRSSDLRVFSSSNSNTPWLCGDSCLFYLWYWNLWFFSQIFSFNYCIWGFWCILKPLFFLLCWSLVFWCSKGCCNLLLFLWNIKWISLIFIQIKRTVFLFNCL